MKSGIWTFCLLIVASLIGVQSDKEKAKIYNGDDAKKNEFPFIVYTNASDHQHYCTGSLIHRRWVLIAAHCLFAGTHVVLGDYERPGNDGNEQVVVIKEEIAHPEFDYRTFSNDIGLIKLAEPADFSSDAVAKTQPLKSKAFMAKMLANGKSCRGLGWGRVDTEEGPVYASKLQKVRVRFVNESEYVKRGYSYMSDAEGAITIENEYTDKCEKGGLCPGDSGGPVVCKQKGNWVVTGINSFLDIRDGCIRGVKAVVNVQLYYQWIQSIINQ